MTEREKMLAGELYDCADTELIERWHLAKRLQQKYKSVPANCLAAGNPCRVIRPISEDNS